MGPVPICAGVGGWWCRRCWIVAGPDRRFGAHTRTARPARGADATFNQVVLDANGVDHPADENVGVIPDPDREAVGTAALVGHGEPPDHVGEAEDLVGGQGGFRCPEAREPGRPHSSLMPYQSSAGPLLLAAFPLADDGKRFNLACSALKGPGRVSACLRCGRDGTKRSTLRVVRPCAQRGTGSAQLPLGCSAAEVLVRRLPTKLCLSPRPERHRRTCNKPTPLFRR